MADKTVEKGIDLTVATVGQVVELSGGSKVTEFTCSDGKKYKTFSDSIRPYLKQGAALNVDVETTTKPGRDGQDFTNRNIVQLYVDGKPVAQQKKGPWPGGGGAPADTPERRLADEMIAACHDITKLEVAFRETVIAGHDWLAELTEKRNEYWMLLLPKGIAAAKAKPQSTRSTNASRPAPQRPATAPKAAEGSTTSPPNPAGAIDEMPRAVKDLGELLEACNTHYKMNPGAVNSLLMIQDPKEIKDPQHAWTAVRFLKLCQEKHKLTTAKVLSELNLSAPLEIKDWADALARIEELRNG